LYLPTVQDPTVDTPSILIDYDGSDDLDASGISITARKQGFPVEGLDTHLLENVALCAEQFEQPPSDELLLESFVYYWRWDACLPKPGAKPPPPAEEITAQLDREFCDELGPERADTPCRHASCQRGAIENSVFCRPHHFEAIKKKACPFSN
jgi:hypothetical protein